MQFNFQNIFLYKIEIIVNSKIKNVSLPIYIFDLLHFGKIRINTGGNFDLKLSQKQVHF